MNRDDVMRMAREAGLHIATDHDWMPIIALAYAQKFAELVAAATLKNSVMTDEEYEQAMADEGQRRMLTFDTEVREMIKEAVEMEREACLNCYSPDDTAIDWADKIRARGQK